MESNLENSSLCKNEPNKNKGPNKNEGPGEDNADFKRSILEGINGIKGIGSFAAGKSFIPGSIPDIRVDNGKPLPIPLSEEAAQDLASKCEKAPYGNHKETLVDETVRKTLQIDAKRIKFHNPEFDVSVNNAAIDIATALGILPAEDGSDVPTEYRSDVPTEYGSDVFTEDGSDVPIEYGSDAPTEDGSDVPIEYGSDAPTEDGSDVFTEDGSDVSTEDGSRVSTEDGSHISAEHGSNIRAKFHKLLLYEPGAMFKPHKE